MRILLVHNSYQQAGGEDAVFQNERALLESHGHEVHTYTVGNEAISNRFSRFLAGLGAVFSLPQFWRIRKVLQTLRPDVVHVHNFFPLISPAVFYACFCARIPVVHTLHNFRIICPTAMLFVDGHVEERSLSRGPWWAVWRRVYRESLLGTAILALMIVVHRKLGTWNRIDALVPLSEFAVEKFSRWGVSRDKLLLKPNFAPAFEAQVDGPRSDFLCVGRLSHEKGVSTLLSAANFISSQVVITIFGDGPLADLKASCGPNVRFAGRRNRVETTAAMAKSLAVVLPSLCYEGFPMVLAEAYANGTPVIASRLGSLSELVEDGMTGLLFNPGDSADLARKLSTLANDPELARRMGRNARQRYEALYSPQANYARLISIYSRALENRS